MSNLSLVEKVQKQLHEDAQSGRIDPIELQSMLLVLSEAKDDRDTAIALELFADKFETFQTILDDERNAEVEAEELDVEKIISKIIKSDPKLADKVAKYALDKRVSAGELKEEFPEIVNFVD